MTERGGRSSLRVQAAAAREQSTAVIAEDSASVSDLANRLRSTLAFFAGRARRCADRRSLRQRCRRGARRHRARSAGGTRPARAARRRHGRRRRSRAPRRRANSRSISSAPSASSSAKGRGSADGCKEAGPRTRGQCRASTCMPPVEIERRARLARHASGRGGAIAAVIVDGPHHRRRVRRQAGRRSQSLAARAGPHERAAHRARGATRTSASRLATTAQLEAFRADAMGATSRGRPLYDEIESRLPDGVTIVQSSLAPRRRPRARRPASPPSRSEHPEPSRSSQVRRARRRATVEALRDLPGLISVDAGALFAQGRGRRRVHCRARLRPVHLHGCLRTGRRGRLMPKQLINTIGLMIVLAIIADRRRSLVAAPLLPAVVRDDGADSRSRRPGNASQAGADRDALAAQERPTRRPWTASSPICRRRSPRRRSSTRSRSSSATRRKRTGRHRHRHHPERAARRSTGAGGRRGGLPRRDRADRRSRRRTRARIPRADPIGPRRHARRHRAAFIDALREGAPPARRHRRDDLIARRR